MLRPGDDKMPSVGAIEESARRWTRELEASEARRSGVPIRMARRIVARRAGLSPGTLENINLRRTKGVRLFVFEALRALFIEETQRELNRLSHDLELARAAGSGSRIGEVAEIEASRDALLEAMKG